MRRPLIVLVLAVAACGGSDLGDDPTTPPQPSSTIPEIGSEEPTTTVAWTTTSTAAATGTTLAPGSIRVTAADFGDEWPLTVEEGVLSCDNDAVVFTVDGMQYAVNGMASTRGVPEIEPIWAEGDVAPRKNIGPLIDRGLELCD